MAEIAALFRFCRRVAARALVAATRRVILALLALFSCCRLVGTHVRCCLKIVTEFLATRTVIPAPALIAVFTTILTTVFATVFATVFIATARPTCKFGLAARFIAITIATTNCFSSVTAL